MLEIRDICFQYQNGPKVLKNIDFSLETGEFLAILGNNGAGKSTLLKCLNKILTPYRGCISMNGEEILEMPTKEVAKRIAFVAQTIPSTQMTVHDIVMLGRRPYMGWAFTEEDHKIVHKAMDILDISPMRGRFLNELSGGERQKVMLARALAQQPKLLLLDEPTSSLDIQNQYQVLQIVQDICKDMNIMAIVVIHDLNLALRFCDSFLLMQEGQVYDYGGPSVLDRKSIWDIYNIQGEVVEVEDKKVVLID